MIGCGVTRLKLERLLDDTTPEGRYLAACARIRRLTIKQLIDQVLWIAIQDQLVGAILDDIE